MKQLTITLLLFGLTIIGYSQETYCYTGEYELQEKFDSDDSDACGPSWTWDWEDIDHIFVSYGGEYWEYPIIETLDLYEVWEDIITDLPDTEGDAEGYLWVNITYQKDCGLGGTSTLDNNTIRIKSPVRARLEPFSICPSGSHNFETFLVPGAIDGGEFNIPGITIGVSGIADMLGVASGTYSGTYEFNDGGCIITSDISSFTVYNTPSVSWIADPVASLLDTDDPINLTDLVTASGGSHSITGSGVYNVDGVYYFDPSAAGGAGDKILTLKVTSGDGCVIIADETRTIEVVHDPGTPSFVWINIIGSGFDNAITYAPEMLPLNYDPDTYPGGFEGFVYYLKMLTLQWGHSVCEGEVINFVAADPIPDNTYTWYSDVSGEILEVGTGVSYEEIVPESDEHFEYKIFLSTTNFLGEESIKDPYILSVNPYPNNPDDLFFCHDGDDTYSLPITYDHPLVDSFYVDDILITERMEKMTNYNWYDTDEVFFQRNYDYFNDWNEIDKTNEFLFKRIDSSKVLVNDSGNPFFPYGIDDSDGLAYNYMSCACEALDYATLSIVKRPELAFTSNLTGEVETGTPVQFTNESLFCDSIIWNFGDSPYDYYGNPEQWYYYYDLGYHDLEVTALDHFGCFDYTLVPNYISIEDWTGIDELSDLAISIFPNPTSDNINIIGDVIKVVLFNSIGELVYQGSSNVFSIKHFAPGTYFIRVENESGYHAQIITKL